MDWSDNEIRSAIADNEISAITLDTSVFDGNGNRFEHGLLPRLSQFNTTDVSFVLSDRGRWRGLQTCRARSCGGAV